jgi:two-component system cell cycle response regulator
MRALNENKTFVKLEYEKNKIYLVTAIPIELSDRKFAIEFFKDITNSIVLGSEIPDTDSEIHQLIDQLQQVTLKDALTGIFNRRFLNEKLPAEIAFASETGRELSVIMADIDLFKNVNDEHGHGVGDEVLTEFAQAISRCLTGADDWVSRYGGEEFLICLPNTGLKEAVNKAEEIRAYIEAYLFPCQTVSLHITSSFGVCSLSELETKDMNHLLGEVDKMLYLAKQNRRNRVGA